MDALTLILTIILMACCIALIAIILFQAGRTANVSDAVTGGMGNFMGKNKGASRELFLQRATIICSIVFAVIVIVVNLIQLVK